MKKKLLMVFLTISMFSSLSMFGMHIVEGIQEEERAIQRALVESRRTAAEEEKRRKDEAELERRREEERAIQRALVESRRTAAEEEKRRKDEAELERRREEERAIQRALVESRRTAAEEEKRRKDEAELERRREEERAIQRALVESRRTAAEEEERRKKVEEEGEEILPAPEMSPEEERRFMWSNNRVAELIKWARETRGTGGVVLMDQWLDYSSGGFINDIYQLRVPDQFRDMGDLNGNTCGPMSLRNCSLLNQIFGTDNTENALLYFNRLIRNQNGVADARRFINNLREDRELMGSLLLASDTHRNIIERETRHLRDEKSGLVQEQQDIADRGRLRLQLLGAGAHFNQLPGDLGQGILQQGDTLDREGRARGEQMRIREIGQLQNRFAGLIENLGREYMHRYWREARMVNLHDGDMRIALNNGDVPGMRLNDNLTIINGDFVFGDQTASQAAELPAARARIRNLRELESHCFVLGNMVAGRHTGIGHWIAIFVIRGVGNRLHWFVMDSLNGDDRIARVVRVINNVL